MIVRTLNHLFRAFVADANADSQTEHAGQCGVAPMGIYVMHLVDQRADEEVQRYQCEQPSEEVHYLGLVLVHDQH
jgi:hypothetical protein